MTQIVRGLSVGEGWAGVNALSQLGVKPAAFTGAPLPSAGAMAAPTPPLLDKDGDKPWHPDSPLFWFGLLLATTMGLIGASTAIRVGPFKAALGAGTT
jgi:hypothetical protein